MYSAQNSSASWESLHHEFVDVALAILGHASRTVSCRTVVILVSQVVPDVYKRQLLGRLRKFRLRDELNSKETP